MRNFRRYTNQEIYEILTKKISEENLILKKEASMKKEAAFFVPLLLAALAGGAGAWGLNSLGRQQANTGEGKYRSDPSRNDNNTGAINGFSNWWGNTTSRISQGWDNLIDSQNPAQLRQWEADVPMATDIPNFGANLQPQADQAYSLYRELGLRLRNLEVNRGNQDSLNAVMDTFGKFKELLDNNTSPELGKYIQGLLATAKAKTPTIFSGIPSDLFNRKITSTDANGQSVAFTANSLAANARNIYQQGVTKKPTQESYINQINAEVANGKLDPADGRRKILEYIANEKKTQLENIIYNAKRKGDLGALESDLDAFDAGLDTASEARFQDYQLSPEVKEQFREKMLQTAHAYGLTNFANKMFDNKFGDLATNPLYKNDHNARLKAYESAKKYMPGMTQADFYKKIYGNNNFNYNNKRSNLSFGYDDDTGELIYGYGMNRNNWKRMSMDRSMFDSLGNNENAQYKYDRLLGMGLDKNIAKDLVSRNGNIIRTRSHINGAKVNPYVHGRFNMASNNAVNNNNNNRPFGNNNNQ